MKALPFIAIASALPLQALAQDYDDYDDYNEDRVEEAAPARQEVVREVVKGFFAKANVGTNVGTTIFFGRFAYGGATKAGTTTTIGVGSDFVDQDKFSMAWELSFNQGIHNGLPYEFQGDDCNLFPCHQGDLRTYSFIGSVEASTYPSRRIGLGARLGAGLLISPLLMTPEAYERDVVQKEFGVDPGWHSGVKPVFLLGPTFEYYSKLSHFSVGIDADVFYGIGWDLGVNATGYFKYTF